MNESPPEPVRRAPEGPAAESRSRLVRRLAAPSARGAQRLAARNRRLEQDQPALPRRPRAGPLRRPAGAGLRPRLPARVRARRRAESRRGGESVPGRGRRTPDGNPRVEPNRPRTRPRRSPRPSATVCCSTLAVIAFLGVAAALSFYVERRATCERAGREAGGARRRGDPSHTAARRSPLRPPGSSRARRAERRAPPRPAALETPARAPTEPQAAPGPFRSC